MYCTVHEHAQLFPYPEAVDPSDTLETGFTRLVVSQSATSAFLDCSKHKIQTTCTYIRSESLIGENRKKASFLIYCSKASNINGLY